MTDATENAVLKIAMTTAKKSVWQGITTQKITQLRISVRSRRTSRAIAKSVKSGKLSTEKYRTANHQSESAMNAT